MSATNRGAERAPNDFYETPEWLTRAILPHLPKPAGVLEPAAGRGAIARVVQSYWPTATVHQGDLAPQSADIQQSNFLAYSASRGLYDLVITNPPYSLAQAFVEKALTAAPVVAMLLRVNFLGGQKRAAWLRANTPACFVTPRRPSFVGGKTDATEYAWLVWGIEPRVVILETEKTK